MHIEVKNLPQSLKSALESVSYHCADISVEAADTWCPCDAGGDGYRAFCMIVDLETGKRETSWGSWGGANMFNPRNRVDLDRNHYPMAPNMAVIQGSQGGSHGGCRYATVRIHPDNLAPLLPAPEADELTPRQAKIINIYCGIRGGYRDEYLRDGRVEKWELEQLEALGYLKINRAGAVSVTTKARNARTERSSSSCLWRWTDEERRKPEKVERAERSFAVEGARVCTDDSGNGVSLWIHFPDKPPLFVRNEMKANGFVWSRDRRAWVPTIKTYQEFGHDRAKVLAFAEKFVPKEMAA